jgi:hypothetical protein
MTFIIRPIIGKKYCASRDFGEVLNCCSVLDLVYIHICMHKKHLSIRDYDL